MPAPFEIGANQITSPAMGASAITPSDSVDLVKSARGVYVGATGDLKVTLFGGSAATFVGLAAGMIHPIACTRIWATGTTATSIVALY